MTSLTLVRLYSSMELKDNTVIVVLGASGDLAKKKTVCSSASARPNPAVPPSPKKNARLLTCHVSHHSTLPSLAL